MHIFTLFRPNPVQPISVTKTELLKTPDLYFREDRKRWSYNNRAVIFVFSTFSGLMRTEKHLRGLQSQNTVLVYVLPHGTPHSMFYQTIFLSATRRNKYIIKLALLTETADRKTYVLIKPLCIWAMLIKRHQPITSSFNNLQYLVQWWS